MDGGLSLGGTGNLGASLGTEGGDILPPIGGAPNGMGGTADRGMRRTGTAGGGSRGGGATGSGAKGQGDEGSSKKGEVKMAPAAPPMQVRAKKMMAIGHLGQAPRLHVAPLGGPYGYGVAQPPLGATMGHGLVRHGSAKESYFFPKSIPEMPDLLRATSDVALGPKGRGSPRRTSPRSPGRGMSREERSQTAPSKGFGAYPMDMAAD